LRSHYRISWLFLNLVEKVLFGFRVKGREQIPSTGPVIIASNHISYCDPPVVGSGVPREVYFLAKEELFKNRLFGWLIRSYNAIPLRRSTGDIGAFRKSVGLLKQGKAVLMFPEGTRSLSGRLLSPKPGVGMIASLTSAPIVPAHVSGTNRLADALLRRSRLEVAFGRPLNASDIEDRSGDSKQRYLSITKEVMERIADLAEGKGGQEPEGGGE
jgi:1-acyl-sn-glycerol-3-phosphate acyltransferase